MNTKVLKKSVIAFAIGLVMVSCGSGNSNKKQSDNTSETKAEQAAVQKMEIDEPVKTFLKNMLPANYSFYTLKDYLPITMYDLRTNGIFVASRVPDCLLPSNVINAVYSGGFLSGTVASLGDTTDGMDKFDGIKMQIAIGITPDGCVNSIRKKGVKRIILFNDDDVKKTTDNDLIKVEY